MRELAWSLGGLLGTGERPAGGPWWVWWWEGRRGQADLEDVVNGPVERGGPTSAWGGCETQHLGEGPCPLQLML